MPGPWEQGFVSITAPLFCHTNSGWSQAEVSCLPSNNSRSLFVKSVGCQVQVGVLRLLLVQQEWISGCVLRAGGFPPPFPEADRFYFCSCTRGNVSKTQALGVREFISPSWKIKAFGLQERTIQRHGTALTWSPAAAISSFMPVPPRDRSASSLVLPQIFCKYRWRPVDYRV